MNHYPTNRALSFLLIAAMLAGMAGAAAPDRVQAANSQPVQVFFMPMSEDMVFASFKKISTVSAPAAPMHTVTGISITSNSTVLYYDQWENGYELDLANPTNVWNAGNPGGTQIWGDHNAANGCPPNRDGRTALTCSDANDALNSGDVIVLENDVPLPRTNAIFYDGRDKLGATKVVAVTRSVWANTPGTVLADAIEVYDTTRWGTSYKIPLGQNTNASSMFSYSSLLVVAAQNNTTVTIDSDGNGTADITRVMNQGDATQVDGGVNSGATVTASGPVQVDLLTGKVGSSYASRWFVIPPVDQWTASLWTAVGTTTATYPADVFIYNPNGSPLTVNYQTKLGAGSFSIAANSTYRYEMPLLSGAHFYTSGSPFLAVGTMDSSVSGADQTFDWGYTLVPDAWLTSAFVAGWAPGTANFSGNGSPVWVTAVKPTSIYVVYSNGTHANIDPRGYAYDVSYSLGQYESKQIYGLNNTQTGMKVYTVDGTSITGAWGEDPAKAQPGTPYLDVGYTIPPLPEVILNKAAGLAVDNNSNGKVDPGDTLVYTVTVRNNGAVTAFNTVVSDTIPTHTGYVPNSARLNGVAIPDSANPTTAYPLDEGGYTIGTIAVGGAAAFTYRMQANTTPPTYASIQNTAHAMVNGMPLVITMTTAMNTGTQCALSFTNSGGTAVTAYQQNSPVYVRVSDSDTQGAGQITAQVIDLASGDRETLGLSETGLNTGIFAGSLPSSSSAGQLPNDGTLYALAGDSLQASHADTVYPDQCSASAAIIAPAYTKSLYFNAPGQGLDRVDPVATHSTTTQVSGVKLGSTGGSGSTTITANRDTYLDGNKPTLNFGKSTTINTNRSSKPMRALIGFDLSSIPAGSTITSATLRLVKTGGNNNNASTDVRALTSDWSEGSGGSSGTAGAANWTQRASATNWGTAGGDFNGTIYGNTSVSNNGTYNWTITSLVQAWFNNTLTNYGLLLKRATESNSNRVQNFSSREGASPPQLLVNYNLPSVTVTNTTFVQSSALGSDLVMPAGGTLGVTAYISVTNGTLPGSPNIQAAIESGGARLFTLSSPVVTSLGSAVYRLDWSGTVGSNTTLPAGQKVTARIISNLSGVAFAILYGSQARPSRIDLPTTTVIKVDALAFYDAAFPGGTLLPNPANGQTVYIRPTVSDPFGPADVVSATLRIKDPAGGTTPVILNDAYAADTTSAAKIYEYPWLAPATQGVYTFTLTANEGYEGLVKDIRAQSVNIIFQDTGTPSKLEFTSGPGGAETTSYDSTGSPTNQICLRLTDFDMNRNPAAIETASVSLRSSSGDAETVTLNETGVNTGIFTRCINRDTVVGSPGNGSLYAPAGSLLSAAYTDPNDPTDQSSAGAVMTTASLAVSLSKQLVEPANAIAAVGERVRFDLTVANPNAVDLALVPLSDTFPSTCMAFDSASLAPDSVITPTLTWDDIGPIAPHAVQVVSVYFKVTAACTPATATNQARVTNAEDVNANQVSAGPVSAALTTTRPQVSVSKTLVSPNPGPASVGDTVQFHISVTNIGTTVISNLPLNDSYSPYCMEFQSATNGGSGGGGAVLWSNLGPLGVGATANVDASFTVRGPCSPSSDLATVSSASDANGDAVPAAQSSASINTNVQPPQLAVKKVLSEPADGVVYPGAPLTYTVSITNTGANAFTSLVITDTYNTCQSLVSTWPVAPTSTSSGQAVWNTLVPPLPPLLAGQAINLTLRMNALSASAGCQNTVKITGQDQYGQTPGVKTSSASVVIAGAIQGVVYNDQNGDGAQSAGEGGLAGAQVTLINIGADGILGSADDVALGTQTSGAGGGLSGGFLFKNLAAGLYQLSETNPSGYASTTRDSLLITLSAGGVATASFGDQQAGAIHGVVFEDQNGNGVQDSGEPGISGASIELRSGGCTAGVDCPTRTSAADGSYIFASLTSGKYTVVESDKTGYVSVTGNLVPVSLASGGAASANFGDQQTGTLGGTVYDDLNGNSRQDPGEAGIGGVSIELRSGSCTAGGNCPTRSSAADGSYQFTAVTAGSYTVVESDPVGYVSVTPNSLAVSVLAGGAASANFGDQQTGTISGVMYEDLNGNGVPERGEPGLGGNPIELQTGSCTASVNCPTTTSGPDGAYQFSGLTAGSYTVVGTTPAGYIATSLERVPVSVPAGGAASANFGVQQTGSVVGVVFNDLNGNGLQEPGEVGIPGVSIELHNGSCTPAVNCPGAVTISDGSFQFMGVPSGSYTVVESDPAGYASTTGNTVPVSVAGGTGGVASARFGDQQTGTVSGTVYYDQNGNGVQDPGEAGISGVTIELRDGSCTPSVNCPTASSAGDGTYLFPGVTPGSYSVVEISNPPGMISTTPDSLPVMVAANGAASASFGEQQPGQVSGVYFNDLNGNGRQDSGEPGISGVSIELRDSSSGALIGSPTVTIGDGTYQFSSVTPGSYSVVSAAPTGFSPTTPASVAINVPANQSAQANFGAMQLGTIAGTVYNDLNGDGAQEPGEAGLGGVKVELHDGTCTAAVNCAVQTSAGDGTYLFSGKSAGDYTVVEMSDPAGFSSVTTNSVPVSLPAGGSAAANFGDQQNGTVSGVVFNDLNGNGAQDAGEKGLVGVKVELQGGSCTAGVNCPTATTASDGTYLFTGVTPGNYTVVESDPSGYISVTPNSMPVSVAPNGAATASFGDRQNSSLSGVVFYDLNENAAPDTGEPGIGGVIIELEDGNCTPGVDCPRRITNGDGSYQFTLLAAGAYTVSQVVPGAYITTTSVLLPVTLAGNAAGSANFGDVLADFGNLPVSYGNPLHTLGGLYLGSGVTAEKAAQSNDPLTDGVSRENTSVWLPGNTVNLKVVSSGPGVLVAWFDWNQDHAFEPGEKVSWTNVQPGSNTLSLSVPGSGPTAISPLNVRFRLYPAGSDPSATSPTGTAVNGEVEDYTWSFNPTAVEVNHFSARLGGLLQNILQALASFFTSK